MTTRNRKHWSPYATTFSAKGDCQGCLRAERLPSLLNRCRSASHYFVHHPLSLSPLEEAKSLKTPFPQFANYKMSINLILKRAITMTIRVQLDFAIYIYQSQSNSSKCIVQQLDTATFRILAVYNRKVKLARIFVSFSLISN